MTFKFPFGAGYSYSGWILKRNWKYLLYTCSKLFNWINEKIKNTLTNTQIRYKLKIMYSRVNATTKIIHHQWLSQVPLFCVKNLWVKIIYKNSQVNTIIIHKSSIEVKSGYLGGHLYAVLIQVHKFTQVFVFNLVGC